MLKQRKKQHRHAKGSVLALVLILVVILSLLGFALIKISEGASLQSLLFQNEQIAMLTAEAAYENAIYWMSQNPDLLLDMDMSGTDGSFNFPDSRADYHVEFYGFVGYRPIFEVTANGYCGTFHRGIRVYVAQSVSGWEMGMCRIPTGTISTDEVYFVSGEIIDMPIHINSYGAVDDSQRDIAISGNPTFLQEVTMEESRYSSGKSDKYRDIINVFDEGILFDQPKSLITDEASIDKKIKWYQETVRDNRPDLVLKPQKNNSVSEAQAAVQLEFFVGTDGVGYVRITNDCTVRGRTGGSGTYDYKVQPGTSATRFEKYPIYAYHYIPQNAETCGKQVTETIESIQIFADYGAIESPPCGMIYVDGSVVIACASENLSDPDIAMLNVVQGKVCVIATGNIWIADSITVSDKDDNGDNYPRQADGMPAMDNPNALGLFTQGVIKVVDPGLVEDYVVNLPGHWETEPGHWETIPGHWTGRGRRKKWVPEETVWAPGKNVWVEGGKGLPAVTGLEYGPVAIKDSGYSDGDYHRHLPDPMVLEAAMTIGGGGWGAENVGYPGGRETSGSTDDLIVRGTLTEVIRGVVGIIGRNGYEKNYYFDKRMLSGLIPGTVRLKGKFVTTPGGWSDFRVDKKPND